MLAIPAAAFFFAAAMGACAPIVERAPFPGRADSLVPGDLLGPFDGIVLDADTERPIAGATVALSWAFERGIGLGGPAGNREAVTGTTADGRYRIPALTDLPSGASTRVRRVTLIVYHRGHFGWRSDRRFPDGEARRDFSQRGCKIRLERWQTAFQHSRHLIFLGGGSTIKTAAAWEVQPAGFELDGRAHAGGITGEEAVPRAGPAPLNVKPLLSEAEVRGVTGYADPFEIGKLTDLPTTEFYDSRHFKAKGRTEASDVGLRVWRLGNAAAETQYRKLLSELPGAETKDEIGDASLIAKAGEVLGLAFLERERGLVVSVTCGSAQCVEPSMVLRLAKLVESHLGDVPALPTDPAKAEDKKP